MPHHPIPVYTCCLDVLLLLLLRLLDCSSRLSDYVCYCLLFCCLNTLHKYYYVLCFFAMFLPILLPLLRGGSHNFDGLHVCREELNFDFDFKLCPVKWQPLFIHFLLVGREQQTQILQYTRKPHQEQQNLKVRFELVFWESLHGAENVVY